MSTNSKSSLLFLRRQTAIGILFAFLVNTVSGGPAFAQNALPLPGSMVNLSDGYAPTLIRGMRVYPENPLRFDFIVDPGQAGLQGRDLEEESAKLIKYFLSSLTVPEKDLWVNLSPYEKDRIIPDAFGKTEMGRDMLGQDYILKQLSASLIYPESELGKSFWAMTYQKAQEAFGGDAPVDTFNKIWIVPEKAVVFAKNNVAYVVESHLKVMLEEDYLALQSNQPLTEKAKEANAVGSQIVRDIIIPSIEKEVNEGRNFAPLRQVYHSVILATWFKRNLKESVLGKVYVGQNKIDGVTFAGDTGKEKIYAAYVEAFKTGVFNYVKEEMDPVTEELIPRKYFSGGIPMDADKILDVTQDERLVAGSAVFDSQLMAVSLELSRQARVQQSPPAAAPAYEIFNLLRDNQTFGPKQDILRGNFDSRSELPLVLGSGSLETVKLFKEAIAANAQASDPYSALNYLRPLTEYLLEKFRNERELDFSQKVELVRQATEIKVKLARLDGLERRAAQAKAAADQKIAEHNTNPSAELRTAMVAAEMEYSTLQDQFVAMSIEINVRQLRRTLIEITPQIQKSAFLSKMPFFLNGNNLSNADVKDLLSATVALTNELSSFDVLALIRSARPVAQDMLVFFARIRQDTLPMENLNIKFVLNGPFARIATVEGQKVLELDLMALLRKPNAAESIIGQYEFLNILQRGNRLAEISEFDRINGQSGSGFIGKNAGIINEAMRIRVLMQRVVDRLETPAEKEAFFAELARDGRNARAIPLLRELSEKKTPQERLETILLDIQNNPRKNVVKMNGQYTANDISLMLALLANMEKGAWFIARKYDLSVLTEEIVETVPAETTPAQTEQDELDRVLAEAGIDMEGARLNAELDLDNVRSNDPRDNDGWEWANRKDDPNFFESEMEPGSEAVSTVSRLKRWALAGALAVAGLFAGFQWAQSTAEAEGYTLKSWMAKQGDSQIANLSAMLTQLQKERAGGQSRSGKVEEEQRYIFESSSLAFATYQIPYGTTLSEVALTYKVGTTVDEDGNRKANAMKGAFELQAQNFIKNANQIQAGATITIPWAKTAFLVLGAEDTSIKRVLEKIYGEGQVTSALLRDFRTANPHIKTNSDLKPGVEVKAIVTTERARELDKKLNYASDGSIKPVPAVASSSATVGGINLDPSGLEIGSLGEDFKFDVPVDQSILQQLQQEPVNGFVPVILNVVPIINLPQFLGLNTIAETKDSLALFR